MIYFRRRAWRSRRRRRAAAARRSATPVTIRVEIIGSRRGEESYTRVVRTGMRDPGPNTLAMVKRSPDGWTLNFLLCNPNERDLDVIEAAERETLEALAEKAPTLTPLGSVAATLVCDLEEVLS